MFSPQEIQVLLSGVNTTGIDVKDLKDNVVYNGVYDPQHPTIEAFWEVVEQDLTDDEKFRLVQYVTSCARPPLLGFKGL